MFKDKTIVYTSGTFDMFHYNHLRMINYARSLADILIVGVSTDELVSSYKAKPIIPFTERLQIIEALKTPDIVIPQHTLDHSEIVKKLNIDAFVVGDDWYGKYDYLKDLGVHQKRISPTVWRSRRKMWRKGRLWRSGIVNMMFAASSSIRNPY